MMDARTKQGREEIARHLINIAKECGALFERLDTAQDIHLTFEIAENCKAWVLVEATPPEPLLAWRWPLASGKSEKRNDVYENWIALALALQTGLKLAATGAEPNR